MPTKASFLGLPEYFDKYKDQWAKKHIEDIPDVNDFHSHYHAMQWSDSEQVASLADM